jgi:hypothetical protein
MPVSSGRVVLGLVAADQSGFDVWGRLSGSGGIWARWCLVWCWFAGPLNDGGSTMAIRIMDDTMTLETGNRVVATALVGERAARRGSIGLSA